MRLGEREAEMVIETGRQVGDIKLYFYKERREVFWIKPQEEGSILDQPPGMLFLHGLKLISWKKD